jgi:DNA-binding NtrC family response regulator
MAEPGARAVLVVDDAPPIRLLCRVNLELDGHRVLEAGTLGDARAAIEADDVRVVVLDVHVGHEDGLDFLRELRREGRDVRVVLLTGSIDLDRARREQADATLGKPFELDELRGVVAQLAASR